MRAGAAGLRASGSRCNLRCRAALPPCRPRSVGRGAALPRRPAQRGMLAKGRRRSARAIVTRSAETGHGLREGLQPRVERGRAWPARPTLRTRIAFGRSTQRQNAHDTEIAEGRTVAYSWHPWVGQAVHVHQIIEKTTGMLARCSLAVDPIVRACGPNHGPTFSARFRAKRVHGIVVHAVWCELAKRYNG